MKLPSIQVLVSSSLRTLERSPLVLLCAFIGVGVAIYFNHCHHTADEKLVMKLIMTCALGIPLFTSLTLISATRSWSLVTKVLIQLVGVSLLVAYFVSLFHYQDDPENYRLITRFFIFNVGLLFLVSFAPCIKQKNLGAFWRYNELFFSRFLTSVFFSHVLFLGISVCLASIDKLLGINIKDKIYFDSWFILVGIFNTWFFLGGIPKDFITFNEEQAYSKALKIFVQYILIPLVTFYFIILYVYTFKILIKQTWPIGWVAWPIIIASLVGMLTLLLSHPLREDTGNKWVKTYSKYFNLTLLPLIVLLLVSIGRRISDYGITENRYFVLVLGIWVGVIAFYFTVSRQKNIKVIPVSLCLIAFMTAWGPWGTFKVSEWSQVKRLENILKENNILVNGKIKIPDPLLVNREASSVIEYLDKWHGFNKVQSWVDTEIPSSSKPTSDQLLGVSYPAQLLGISYTNKWDRSASEKYYYSSESPEIHELGRNHVMINFAFHKDENISHKIDNNYYEISFDNNSSQLNLRVNHQKNISLNLEPLIKDLNKKYLLQHEYSIDPNEMVLTQENQDLWARAFIGHVEGSANNKSPTKLWGEIVIKIKD